MISISSLLQREKGRAAHRTFLDPRRDGHPIILVEDMALARAPSELLAVIVAPLLVQSADGTPCTVLGYAPEGDTIVPCKG